MNTNPNAKRILVYGDSFTYGWMTWVGRYASDSRFTGILQDQLGDGYEIIEEGLRGRMLGGENAFFPYRDGLQQFWGILWSHMHVEVIILFLGTNDCNTWVQKTEDDFHELLDWYARIIEYWTIFFWVPQPEVLLVSPPVVEEQYLPELFQPLFLWAGEKSKQLSRIYEYYATTRWRHFFDTNLFVSSSPRTADSPCDGIYIDAQGHEIIAQHLANYIH
jgi:lysophospholipase L1-like esterase